MLNLDIEYGVEGSGYYPAVPESALSKAMLYKCRFENMAQRGLFPLTVIEDLGIGESQIIYARLKQ